ncbi:hypothetical protein [Burkholderia cenocepacia]|uniref:hypothetical protein n=1 Tax=Burkholderia cenocepacia TaxID=95486 RepID=UPI000F5890B7|nr:hypothetical protein [Burkholderia cenocepacia]
MTGENKYLRAARVIALVNGYTPLLRDELLARPNLVDMAGIETDATITLGAENLSFRRSQLFLAIAMAYDGVSTPVVTTVDGAEWTVAFDGNAQPPNVALIRDDQRLFVLQFSLLAPDAGARLLSFQSIADCHRLPIDLVDGWRLLLSERAPTDHEMAAFVGDLQNSPIGAVEAIRESLRRGNLSIDTLVPRSERYYRELVGNLDEAISLQDCIARVAAPFIANVLAGGDQQSLSMVWPLCSHQAVSRIVEQEWNGDDRILADSIARLIKEGDPISRTGAIELGLRQVSERPRLTQPLTELINSVLDGERGDEFALLSALFICIYGQMARCRILASWQPFARRMASLAHASMVIRQIVEVVVDRTQLIRWLLDTNDAHFFMQVLVDMRVEPRWFPELGAAEQWRTELLGRVWLAAISAPDAVKALGLSDRLADGGPQSFIDEIDRLAVLLPGPLEGGASSPFEIGPQSMSEIEARLAETVDTTAFSGLLNASMFLHVPPRLGDLAAEALERNHYQIMVDERVSLPTCLHGLASVAAILRNIRLCDAIHTALRVSWRLHPGQLTADELFRAGVVACAAHEELVDWSENIGRFMTELSLSDLSIEDASTLLSHLSALCHLKPELWGTCGQAHAAFGLIVGK